MTTRIQFRRGTPALWTSRNPVLAAGEPGYEIGTGNRKTGDGVTPWNGLPYDNGPMGPAGPEGPQGPPGATGLTGPVGPKGDKGDVGATGPAGPEGPQGPAGPVGPKGDRGDAGPQGPAGPVGPVGPQGNLGPQGPIGLTGPQGDEGSIGPAGPQGPQGPIGNTGPQGPVGPQGLRGETGPTGPVGPAGPQGERGLVGPAGVTGAQGPAGPKGDTGDTGPIGPQGVTGATGPIAMSWRGDWSAATNYAVKDAVAFGGASWIAVTDPPVGDEPDVSEHWDLLAAQGAKGDTGNTGATGQTGAQGPQGIQGPTGATGPANTLSVGTVTASAPGSAAEASVTGSAPNQTLNLTLPRGEVGEVGPPGPIGGSIEASLATGEVYPLNPAVATEYTFTLNGNASVTASGMTNGSALTVFVKQDATGGKSFSVPSDWIGGAGLTIDSVGGHWTLLAIWKSTYGMHVRVVNNGTIPASLWHPDSMADKKFRFNGNSLTQSDLTAFTGGWNNDWDTYDLSQLDGDPTVRVAHMEKYLSFSGGGNDSLNTGPLPTNITSPTTLAFVARVTNTSRTPQTIFAFGGGVQPYTVTVEGTPLKWMHNGSAGGAPQPVTGAWQTVVITNSGNGGTATIRVNGNASSFTPGTSTISNLLVGRNWITPFVYADFDLAAMSMVGHVVSGQELADLETYLNKRRDTLNGVG